MILTRRKLKDTVAVYTEDKRRCIQGNTERSRPHSKHCSSPAGTFQGTPHTVAVVVVNLPQKMRSSTDVASSLLQPYEMAKQPQEAHLLFSPVEPEYPPKIPKRQGQKILQG